MKPQFDEWLSYNQETGEFFWQKSPNRRISVGSKAGWMKGDYVAITVGGKKHYAHRIAWWFVYGSMPKQLDHINGVPSDNRITNLRECTQTQNMQNRRPSKRNSTGVKGVFFDKSRGKWVADLAAGEKKMRIRFDSFDDAVKIRNEWALEHHADFAYEVSRG